MLPRHSMAAARSQVLLSNVISFWHLRSLLSRGSVPAFPRTWPKDVRTRSQCRLHVVDVRPFSRQLLVFMASARIASPCFTRPKFELGLSSRAPHVSAKRVRLSCSPKSLVLSFMRHDVLNIDPSTPHLSSSPLAPVVIMLVVVDDSVMHGLL